MDGPTNSSSRGPAPARPHPITRHASRVTGHASRVTRPACRGFTLVELLMTLSIAAFLLLAGVGFYMRMNRGFALSSDVSVLEAELRGARAFAIHERSQAVVVLVEPTPTRQQGSYRYIEKVYSLSKRTVSCWHLEPSQRDGSTLKGALGQTGTLSGDVEFVPGKLGGCLLFNGSSTALSVVTPYLDEIRDGVFVDAHVRPDAADLTDGATLPIAGKPDGGQAVFSLGLSYRPNGTQDAFWLEGSVQTPGGAVTAHTAAIIRPGEWTHVALEYVADQNDADHNLVLRINGREVELYDTAAGKGQLVPNARPMLVGSDGARHFQGRIDEVRVAALVASEIRRLQANADVWADPNSSDRRVHFDDEGKLDPRYHGDTVRIKVISPRDKLQRTIQVNWLGGVEVGQQERQIDQ